MRHLVGLVIFAVCLAVGLMVSYHSPAEPPASPVSKPGGSGFAGDAGPDLFSDLAPKPARNVASQPLKVLSKPKAIYTDTAKDDDLEGTVLLRVTFQANGQIGGISVIKSLPDGLTDAAIDAAKQLKFEPARVNGAPMTVTKSVEYSFTLY